MLCTCVYTGLVAYYLGCVLECSEERFLVDSKIKTRDKYEKGIGKVFSTIVKKSVGNGASVLINSEDNLCAPVWRFVVLKRFHQLG